MLFLQTEMCVQILIKWWPSLCCLFPLTVPLDWTPATQAIIFSPALFFLPCENQLKDVLAFFFFFFLALPWQKPVGFCLNLRDDFARVTVASFAFAICWRTPLHIQLALLETNFLWIFPSFLYIVLFVFVVLHETKKQNWDLIKQKCSLSSNQKQGDLSIWLRNKINYSFVCKSVTFSMWGTRLCLLQQQQQQQKQVWHCDLHFLGYMQNETIYHKPKILSIPINHN